MEHGSDLDAAVYSLVYYTQMTDAMTHMTKDIAILSTWKKCEWVDYQACAWTLFEVALAGLRRCFGSDLDAPSAVFLEPMDRVFSLLLAGPFPTPLLAVAAQK
jgi:hypothetical protein